VDFRGQLTDYVRLYAFLAQILTFADADLEKLYVFARLLRRYLPSERAELPREIQQNVDMDSYRIQPIHRGAIPLERGAGPLDPQRSKDQHTPAADAIEPLSQIIHNLNERFGTDFSAEDRVVIAHLVQKLTGDPALATSVQVNTPENARLTFDHVVTDHLQDMVDTNFKFYKRVTDDQAFARFFLDWLFEHVQVHLKSRE
jgi:type I restriction enzyme, R subunit